MPIDPSIPLQVQPVKMESPINQLAMMESATKMQEMNRAIGEQNQLNEYLRSGADLSSAEGKRGLLNYGKTGIAHAKAMSDIEKSGLETRKLGFEIDEKKMNLFRERIGNLEFNPSPSNVQAHLEDSVKRGEISPEQAQQQYAQAMDVPEAKRAEYFRSLGTKVEERYKMNTVSANTNATNQTKLNIHNAGALNQANIADPYGISGIKPVLAGPSGVITNAPVANNLAPSTMPLNAPVTTSSVLGATTPVANAPKITVKEAIGQGLQGDAFLSTLPPTVQSKLKAIAEYRMAPIPAGSRAPGAQQMTELLSYAYPEYDAKNYHSMNTAQKAFTSGKQGNSTRYFNVVVDHLSTLSQLNDAIANGDMPLINTLANTISTQTGQPAPNSFDAVKRIVGDEITKAVIGAGGALGDRKEVADRLSAANSPAQFKGVVKAYTDLMAGQLSGLETQYKASTGKDDYREKFLTPNTRQALAGKSGTPNAASLPAGVGADWVLKTDAKGNKAYVSPDNSKFVEVK